MKDEFSLEAEVYDRAWAKNGYEDDVKFLDEFFRKHRCRRVLDVGCGTGNHALRLAKLGYEVTGVDVSAEMIAQAKRKDRRGKVTFLVGDMKRIDKVVPANARFDAAICLGNAFQHLTTDRYVCAFLNRLSKMLRTGSLFVFSARNVRKISEDHLNRLQLDHMLTENNLQLLVLAYNTRDTRNPNVVVWRPIFLMNKNGKVDMQIREHKLRWFEPSELKRLLTRNHFEVLKQYSGPDKKVFDENEHATMWLITQTGHSPNGQMTSKALASSSKIE